MSTVSIVAGTICFVSPPPRSFLLCGRVVHFPLTAWTGGRPARGERGGIWAASARSLLGPYDIAMPPGSPTKRFTSADPFRTRDQKLAIHCLQQHRPRRGLHRITHRPGTPELGR